MFQKSPKKPTSSITFKTPEEIEKMRVAGRLAAEVLRMIHPHVREGVTTEYLDRLCHDHIVNVQQAIPAPLNYRGFPKSICTSVNHVVCHGIPGPKTLKKGDVLNIDITVIKDGYHGDTSRMFHVGPAPIAAQRVSRVSVSYTHLDVYKRQIEIGFTVDLDHGDGLSRLPEYDQTFSSEATGLLVGLGLTSFAHQFDCGLNIASDLLQCSLALHHSRASAFT